MTNVSIVTYKTASAELTRCIETLNSNRVNRIYIIDNSREKRIEKLCTQYENVRYIACENRGYGAGHNIAIRKSIAENADYHLVMNSDVTFDDTVIEQLTEYMNRRQDVAQVQPNIVYPDGKAQYTCRLLPSPADLIFRRFLPAYISRKNDERYLLKFFDHQSEADIPYHQGSFMLFRTKCFEKTGLFDERFFMYPEDIDITRRMHQHYRTMFVPIATVVHCHQAASYRSFRMTMVHIVNMIRYFNKWGWFFDKERKRVNKETIEAIRKAMRQP